MQAIGSVAHPCASAIAIASAASLPCLRERASGGVEPEMREAADLDVGPVDQPRERQALLQVSLGIVQPERPQLDDAEVHQARPLARRCSSVSSVTESASTGSSSGRTSRRAVSRSPRRRASASRATASMTAK